MSNLISTNSMILKFESEREISASIFFESYVSVPTYCIWTKSQNIWRRQRLQNSRTLKVRYSVSSVVHWSLLREIGRSMIELTRKVASKLVWESKNLRGPVTVMTPLEREIEQTRSIFGVVDEYGVTEEKVVGVESRLDGSISGEGIGNTCAIVSRALIAPY